jgi:hypothetical protein
MEKKYLDIKIVAGNATTWTIKPRKFYMTFEVCFALDEETFTEFKNNLMYFDYSLNEKDFVKLIKKRI